MTDTPEHPQGPPAEPVLPEPAPTNDLATIKTRALARWTQVMPPQYLKMLSSAAGGFYYDLDPKLPPNRRGYTDMETRTIFLNPRLLLGDESLGIEPMNDLELEGFSIHESGHHAPQVVELQNRLFEHLADPTIIPESYRGSPAAEKRFYRALSSNLHNALADIWLEAYMGRDPFKRIDHIMHTRHAKHVPDSFARRMVADGQGGVREMKIPRPDQLIQALLITRFYPFPDDQLAQMLDPEVFESYQRLIRAGAMEVMTDRWAFEAFFATKQDEKDAIASKFNAYKKAFLPEYLKLMEVELEERKEQKQKEKSEGGEGGQGQRGEGQFQDPVGESVPLTKEEEDEIIDQLLKELEKAGESRECHAVDSDDEHQGRENMFRNITEKLRKIREGKEKMPEMPPQGPPDKRGLEALEELAERLRKQREAKERSELAAKMKIREESIASWKRIKEKYKRQIDDLAAALSEIFLDDRRSKMRYGRREGQITPGLEGITISAVMAGQLSPPTRQRSIKNPEFLETEKIFVVDNSGSMSGVIQGCVETMVVITEAEKQVIEALEAENLVGDDEIPLRIGVVRFETGAETVTELDVPLSDEKELKIIDGTAYVGGGTDEIDALELAKQKLRVGQPNVLKVITVFSDGYGNREAVAPIMRQIEADDEIIFFAACVGDTQEAAEGVLATYMDPLADRQRNVLGVAVTSVDELLPLYVDFVRREVEKRRSW